LASPNSYAIVPGYQFNYAPSLQVTNGNAGVEQGWGGVAVGQQITLDASTNGLAAGTYTLLPARYALLPGAVLVTLSSGTPSDQSVARPDGSSLVAGYISNGLNATAAANRAGAPIVHSLFEIDSSAVVHARAEYDIYSANQTFPQAAATNNAAVPR